MQALFGRANTNFHARENTVTVPLKQPGTSPIPLLEICKAATPLCQLNPFLFNGHFQTIWTTVSHDEIGVFYKRHVFQAEDPSFPGSFAVDFAVPWYEGKDDSLPPHTTYFTPAELDDLRSDDCKPLVVTLHGLSGGSHELYLRHVLKPLIDDGWEACVVNSRGCAESQITSGIMYNARATWDLRQTVRWLKSRFPNRPLFGLGFSLGANILVNYLGEEAELCPFAAAVVVSNPWNLEISSLALQRTWLGLEGYSRAMGTSMRRLFEHHAQDIERHSQIDTSRVRGTRYLFEFDRELQCPTWGYPTEGAYYRDASSCDSLLAVRTPLFAINATDDPIAVKEALPIQEFRFNPCTVLCTTSLGGHLGWFRMDGTRWFVEPVTKFFKLFAEDVDLGGCRKDQPCGREDVGVESTAAASFMPMRRKLQLGQTSDQRMRCGETSGPLDTTDR